MRILQIGATFVGAQKKIEYAVHKCAIEQGHESAVLYAIGESSEKDIVCYENKFDAIIRRGMRKIFGKNPKFALLSTLKLIRYIKKYKPDLVNIHIIHHGYLDYEKLLGYLAKTNIITIFTVHDMWFFTGGCYYYSVSGCDGFLKGCRKCPKEENELDCKKRDVAKCFEKKVKLFRNLKKIGFVSVSPWVHSEINKSFLKDYPQFLVMNAADSVSIPPKTDKRQKFTIIGVANNWDERKGLGRFYSLGSQLLGVCDIILVGNISEQMKIGAPENIEFYGYANSAEELHKLYSLCDLHVSMSYEETFGLTFVEAALSGIRSMGFSSTAIPAVLKKTGGYVVSPCTVENAVEIIKDLVTKRETCVIDGDEYCEIRKYFSPDRMALEYAEIYKEMYDTNGSKRNELK